eukprot:m.44230 g.44230  ORF g.44230 m.44230 type:complete len:345 (-) comp11686_c0_seq3:713-1747(-)
MVVVAAHLTTIVVLPVLSVLLVSLVLLFALGKLSLVGFLLGSLQLLLTTLLLVNPLLACQLPCLLTLLQPPLAFLFTLLALLEEVKGKKKKKQKKKKQARGPQKSANDQQGHPTLSCRWSFGNPKQAEPLSRTSISFLRCFAASSFLRLASSRSSRSRSCSSSDMNCSNFSLTSCRRLAEPLRGTEPRALEARMLCALLSAGRHGVSAAARVLAAGGCGWRCSGAVNCCSSGRSRSSTCWGGVGDRSSTGAVSSPRSSWFGGDAGRSWGTSSYWGGATGSAAATGCWAVTTELLARFFRSRTCVLLRVSLRYLTFAPPLTPPTPAAPTARARPTSGSVRPSSRL